MLGRRVLGANEREHLDLVELVDAEDPARVLAGRAGLAPEAGGESRVAARQLVGGEDLVGVQRRQRHLRGPDQEQLVARDLVDHLPLAGEEAGAEQRALADQHRRHDRHETLARRPARSRSGSAPARPSPGRRAGRRTATRTPPPPSPSRSSRSRARARGGRGPRSRSSGRSPTSRSVTASSSVTRPGPPGSGRLGSSASSSSRFASTSASSASSSFSSALTSRISAITWLGVAARALRRRDLVRGAVLPGPPLLDLGQQLAAARVEAQAARRGHRRRRGARARPGPGSGSSRMLRRSSIGGRLASARSPTGNRTRCPAAGSLPASEPAYLETNFATLVASWPVRMFWGMIAPEKPPLRIANRTSSKLSLRWSRFGPCWRSDRLAEPWVPAGVRVWQPEQRSENRTAPR